MRVWLITGAAGGLGGAFARAAIGAGDQVVATARDAASLRTLEDRGALTLSHDVTDRAAAFAVVDRALERFGRIDVAVNNAGYAIHAAVEELTEAEIRAQLETNFFGALWVCQAVPPPCAGSARATSSTCPRPPGPSASRWSAPTRPASSRSRA